MTEPVGLGSNLLLASSGRRKATGRPRLAASLSGSSVLAPNLKFLTSSRPHHRKWKQRSGSWSCRSGSWKKMFSSQLLLTMDVDALGTSLGAGRVSEERD